MAVPSIALYTSPPSSVCSTPYPCQINALTTYDFELNSRSSSTNSSSASSSQKPIVGGLSRLFSSPAVKHASFSGDREELGCLWHDRGDEFKELGSSFCYTPCKYLAGSSMKRDQSPVSVLQGQVSCSSSPPMRTTRERGSCEVGFQSSIHGPYRGGANGLFNGFVRNALGSCVDYDSPSFEVRGDGADYGSSSVAVDELTFSMEDSFVEANYEPYVKELLLGAQLRHKIFCDNFVIKAFYEAEKAHRGQMRASGDPYLEHCVETAVLLAIIGANSSVVAAGLLHDSLDDSFLSYDYIFKTFGAGVADLVEGVSKLSQLSKLARENNTASKTVEADRLHTMFLAMADARAVLIKLADRLHNMITLDALPLVKQKRFAKETLEIFAPLANRLGISTWKEQLENLCFKHLNPDQHKHLSARLLKSFDEAMIASAKEKLDKALTDEAISYHLHGRHKSLYSIHCKMSKKKLNMDQIHDIRGLRLIVENKEDCYRALRVVQCLWSEVPGKFKDYISNPKFNGYRSLHIVVMGEGTVPLEVQIRTKEMHLQAEFGFAAHWRYKEGDCKHSSFVLQMVEWARWVITWQCETVSKDHPSIGCDDSIKPPCTFPSHSDGCPYSYKPHCGQDGPIFVIMIENDKMSVQEFPADSTVMDLLERAGRASSRWSPYGFPVKEELRPRLNHRPVHDATCKLKMGDVVELTPAIPDKSLSDYREEMQRMYEGVSEIRETAYDVEDIIEEFALKVALRRRSGMVNVMKRYATLAKETVELHNVGNKIQIIKNRISSLTKSLETYGIIQRNDDWCPGLGRQQQQLRRSYSHIVEEDTVGLEEDVEVLAEQLVNSNGIVSICGMGGLGKTTLAKKVYHNSKVRHHFDSFAWAYVSQQCQVREIWEGILFKLTNPSKEQREEIANLRDEELVKRLYLVQLEKKCLVILDDIWTIPTWNNLCPAFPYWKTAGSKILLTTRKMDVALHPDPTCFLHVPPQLNDDESWELFKKKACVDSNFPDFRIRAEIERLGREMVGRCRGLPLAIIVLGGLLATKKTIFEWDEVRRNIISHLRRGKGDEQLLGVTEVLALSYHELPYQLKPCFLHLAHFPEDCEIQTKKMIRMWVAEGFVSSVYNGVEEETMEDVAQRYLGELVERCMVQVVERGTTGRIRTCRMHDLMRDLCVSKANQENFLEVSNQSLASDCPADSFPLSMAREARSTGRLRRLAVILEGDLHKFIPSGYKRNSHLRSLLYFHEKACHVENWGLIKSVFKNFKLIRVLDLEGIQSHGGKLPKEIGCLIHLRFLSLRDTDIDELPNTIGNLRYLQTLDLLTWNSTVQIPNVVWRLHRLRHLYLPESCGEDSYKWQLANLINLQTLVNFPADKCEIIDLVRLNQLKKLVIDDPKFGAIFRSPRVRFYRLQSLSFVSNEDSTVVQVIQGCPNLYKLHIEGQIEKLPECQQFSANLSKLNLLGSKLTEDPMPTLEKLPNLRILRLQMDSFLGNKVVCLDKGFPQLKSLFLYDLPNLEEWKVVEGAMANLFHLEISNCTSLNTVPEGLRFINSLREMEIRSMLKAFRTRLEHGGEDYYKVQHVPSIAFRYCDY